MDLQHVMSLTRKAVDDYNMIEDGDRIAVGVSGGKDSLTLLKSLQGLSRFYPHKFELFAITVDLGFGIQDFGGIEKFCNELDVPYYKVDTQIGEIIFDIRKESNPCALCAKMRKGAFNNEVIKLNCNKVAYSHHKDDFVNTALLSLVYEGRFYGL